MKVLRNLVNAAVTTTFVSCVSCLVVACGQIDKQLVALEQTNGSQDAMISSNAPKSAAVSLAFEDTAERGGYLSGSIKISRAIDEKTVSQYVLYWGSDKETKLADSPPIATLAKGQGELSFNIPKGTVKPINATHILVRTKNKNGEMSNGPGILIVDKGVPTNWATSVAFKDSNPSGGKVDGTVSVSKALSEEDLTDYVLYWSADSFSKLGSPPIAVLPKTGKNLAYSLPKDTALPPEAKYLLVVTKNSDGEMSQGVSALIVDVGVPVNAATSVAFKDSDMAGGKIGGEISVSKSLNESDITHYYLYFGSSESTKQNKIPFAVLPKTGNNLKFNVPTGTLKPTDATHILVFTRNADGEMATGVSAPIADLGVPENAAVSVSFRDENVNGGKIDGTVSISRAVNEKDLTHYVVYFGTDASTKQSTASVAEVAKTGANLNVQLPASTIKPTNAKYLLVFTRNADGEMATGVSVELNDLGIPVNAAASVTFRDIDLNGRKIAGDIAITKAANESDVTQYVLYFGSSASTKLSGNAIKEIAKTGSNLIVSLPLGTDKPTDATHFLVYTRNADGEMATGTSFAIIDKGVPEHAAAGVAFTDGDEVGGKLAGDIVITKAANESDVTGYVVYFGSNATTKVSDTFIRDVEKTGSDLAVSLPSGTDKPANATHLLVFTRNGDGKMATPTSLKISDKGVPLNAAVGVSFKDTDINGNKIAGDILITKASDESDITEYEIYFGSDPTTKMGQTAITRIAPSGKNIMVSLPPEGIIKPSSASHLLVFTKNQYGQMATGVAVLIDDAAPTQVKSGYQFTCALMIDKTVRCWGNNEYGQLGDGTFLQRTTPTPVVGLIGVNSLHFGLSHVCALKEDKTVSCWGDNSNSQLGDGTNVSRPLPTKVVGLDSVSSLSGDHSHTCALLANKTVKCWGRNWNGQLGDGTFTDKTLPTVAVGLNNVDSLTSSCALLSDKTVKCWGSWTGNGSADNVATPAQVPGLSNVISMSQSGLNTCVVFEDKSVKCWGDNIMGELGDNTQVSKNDPTQVLNLSMVTSISTDQFLCAVLNNKTVKCWGSNFSGQVGDNTNQHKLLPVLVPNVSDVVSLSQSESHTCVLLADKTVKCWGSNNSGQLGEGTSLDNSTVIRGLVGVVSVSTGGGHTCALLEDKTIKCWGANWNGQLGDGTFIQKSAPTTVSPTVVVKSDPNAVPMTFDEASTYCKRCHEFAKSPSLWKNNAAASKSRLVEGTMPPQNRYYDMFSRYPYSANLTTADRQRLIDYISGL